MYLILGAGINGLLTAQAMRMAKLPFRILDKAGMMKSGAETGFFYAHEANPFTKPDPFLVISHSCPGGSAEKYARKVYGPDAKLDPEKLSFKKYAIGDGERIGRGWEYDLEKLREGLTVNISNVESIRTNQALVLDSEGHAWGYDEGIYSTIPLPILFSKLSPKIQHDPSIFHHRPIHVAQQHIEKLPVYAHDSSMHVFYCASYCHSWYRATWKEDWFRPRFEWTEEPEEWTLKGQTKKITPGKIWYETGYEGMCIDNYVRHLSEVAGLTSVGRYGAWIPKLLTSGVWSFLRGRFFPAGLP